MFNYMGRREEFNPKRRVIRGHSNRNPFEENEDTDNPSRFYNPVKSLTEEEELSQRRPKEDGGWWVHVNGWD